jgi:hypothetical protein
MLINKYTCKIKFIAIILIILFLASMLAPVVGSVLSQHVAAVPADDEAIIEPVTEPAISEPEPTEPEIVLNDEPVLFPECTYITWYDIDLCNEYINEISLAVDTINTAIESAEYTEDALLKMRLELDRLNSIISYTEADVRHYTTWEEEHYYAAKTWLFFKQQGYSDVVTSAIIGNMMAETGGGTLDLNPTIYGGNGGYYGLCQWSLYYKPIMADMPFEHQLVFLTQDMPIEFKYFGKCYRRGFTYEDFLAMEDPGEAGYVFAVVYERCESSNFSWRRSLAKKAYNYFTSGVE